MYFDRIYHFHTTPIGKLIKSSPNQIAYLCDKEYIGSENYFQITGFQNRCPGFMIPEVLEWYFKKERISNASVFNEIDKIASMIDLANFYHMIQFGTIPNFYLGYIEKGVAKSADMDEIFRNSIRYNITFYTDFKNTNAAGVKLEFIYVYNKKEKTFILEKIVCSSDYRSNFYANTNDALLTKIALMNALTYKNESQIGNPVYLDIYKELKNTIENMRNSICIDGPIDYDKFRWFSEETTYPFNMDFNFCRVCTNKELNNPLFFKSYLTCMSTDNIISSPVMEKIDGIINIEDPFKHSSYLNNTQFVAINEYPDFNTYYQFNPFTLSFKPSPNDDDITKLNRQFNITASNQLLGISIFKEQYIKAININHPLAAVVYINSTRELLNKIIDNMIHKFVTLDRLKEQGVEPVFMDEKEGKIFFKQKDEENTSSILISDQIKNMDKDELNQYTKELLKNITINGKMN